MAQPARSRRVPVRQTAEPAGQHVAGEPAHDEEIPLGPSAVELRYRYHRAVRNARVRRAQESTLARFRFYLVLGVLVALAIAFVVGSWHEIQRLFGL